MIRSEKCWSPAAPSSQHRPIGARAALAGPGRCRRWRCPGPGGAGRVRTTSPERRRARAELFPLLARPQGCGLGDAGGGVGGGGGSDRGAARSQPRSPQALRVPAEAVGQGSSAQLPQPLVRVRPPPLLPLLLQGAAGAAASRAPGHRLRLLQLPPARGRSGGRARRLRGARPRWRRHRAQGRPGRAAPEPSPVPVLIPVPIPVPAPGRAPAPSLSPVPPQALPPRAGCVGRNERKKEGFAVWQTVEIGSTGLVPALWWLRLSPSRFRVYSAPLRGGTAFAEHGLSGFCGIVWAEKSFSKKPAGLGVWREWSGFSFGVFILKR